MTPEELEAANAKAEAEKAEKAATAQRFEALERGLRVLAEAAQSTQAGMTQLLEKVESIGQPKNKVAGADEDVDLETMDRKEFAAYLMSNLRGTMEEGLKPFKQSFQQLDEKIDAHGLSTMIKDFKKDHPDFFEWKAEMQALIKENPTLTPARAYSLARAEARPERIKEVDAKYGLGKPEQSNGADMKFLSLFPANGSSSTTKGAGRMKPNEAAEAAWNSVMSTVGQTVN